MPSETTPILDRLLKEVSSSAWEDWLVKLLAAVLVGLIALVLKYAFRRVRPKLTAIWAGKANLERALASVSPDSRGLWLASQFRPSPPKDYAHQLRVSKPIIVVANLKGGVGKTTVAANLIAHYAIAKNERVLGIDLDFQGSLTANALSQQDRDNLLVVQTDGGLSKAAHLINDRDAEWLTLAPDSIAHVPTGKLISAYYSLAAMENRVMIEWLLGKRTDDIRYHLARLLHDPMVQNSFDRIIIDAPPRLTTACVQALCAGTHVLIPTVLDDLSAEAVGAFADQLRIHQDLWPHLEIVGVVGTMTENSPVSGTPLTPVEIDAHAAGREALKLAVQTAGPALRDATFLPTKCFIPDKSELARVAGHRIAYASESKAMPVQAIRECFDRLGDELDRRL